MRHTSFCMLLLSAAGSAGHTPAPPRAHCGNLDVVFVLDASKSIGPKSWQIDLGAAAEIAGNFTFGCQEDPQQVQSEMGIIQFASNVSIPQAFTCVKKEFLATLDGLKEPCDHRDKNCKAFTATGDAMAAAKKLFASGRPDSEKVLVLITDGVPCMADTPNQDIKCTNKTGTACSCLHKLPSFDPFDPPATNTDPQPDVKQAGKATKAATAMQTDGITVIGVAVGKEFGKRGRKFMDGIVSQPASKYLFNPKSWRELPDLVREIVDSIPPCPTPAPTPVPTPVPTQCSVELDVLFVMDASKSIGPHGWQIDLDAASKIADSFTFGCKDDPSVQGAQAEMGIVEFATNVTTPQQFTCDKPAFMTSISGLKEPCDHRDKNCKAFTATAKVIG
eukprot:gene3402-9653_t